MHLDFDYAIALTRLAAPPFDIEAKASGLIPTGARFLCSCKELAHRREDSGIGCRIGSRGAANRALIDIDDFVE